MYIPKSLHKLTQWVNVGDNKVPMQCRQNAPASCSDPNTWDTFENAVQNVQNGTYKGIGFVFADNGIIGIDLDDAFDEENFLTPMAAEIIGLCKSYTEVSQSGRGIHILIKADMPIKGANNRKGVEIYKTGRYFILTGNTMLFKEIKEGQEAVDHILKTYFGGRESTGKKNPYRYQPKWNKPGKKISLVPEYSPINNGSRNMSLASIAGSLRESGYTQKEMYEELLRINSTQCDPPLPQYEIENIVKSICRYKRK